MRGCCRAEAWTPATAFQGAAMWDQSRTIVGERTKKKELDFFGEALLILSNLLVELSRLGKANLVCFPAAEAHDCGFRSSPRAGFGGGTARTTCCRTQAAAD